jgi:hypothetical protein
MKLSSSDGVARPRDAFAKTLVAFTLLKEEEKEMQYRAFRM